MGQAESDLPAGVAAFLRTTIESYEQLEALLLLRRTAARAWDADAVASELSVPATIAEMALEGLHARGLVARETLGRGATFRYGPRDPNVDPIVGRLADVYAEKRLEIVRVMSANAIERIRTAAMRTFADAFVVRRKDDDG